MFNLPDLTALFGKRMQKVKVALVHDRGQQKFLVAYNPKWDQYTFPTKKAVRKQEAEPSPAEAIAALREVIGGRKIPSSDARLFGEYQIECWSGRTKKKVTYDFQVFLFDAANLPQLAPALQVPSPGQGQGPPCQLLPYRSLVNNRSVSWPTNVLARLVMEDQQVGVAVFVRQGSSEREYLMVRNAGYGGFFLPSSRLKVRVVVPLEQQNRKRPEAQLAVHELDEAARKEAVQAVCKDIGLKLGLVHLAPDYQIMVQGHQLSATFQQRRRYRFHLCKVVLGRGATSLDAAAIGRLEASLRRVYGPPGRNSSWRWVPESEIETASPATLAHSQLSPTVLLVGDGLLKIDP